MSLIAAAVLPDCTASIRSAGPAASAVSDVRARTRAKRKTFLILDLRKRLDAIVADLVGFDARALCDREEQVRERRLIGISQMLSAFDLAVRASDDRHRQREVIVAIAVAHVAAPDEKRMIEHGAVA